MKTVARSICVVVLTVLALAGTVPAGQAKGPTDVVVSGPGVDDVHLTYTEPIDDVDAGTLGDVSQLYDVWSPGKLGPAPDLSADQLGPRYVLNWSGDPHGDGNDDIVVQHAYPFAEGGAWIEFLPGQEMYGAPIASGWVQAPRLRTEMVELGAVEESPEPAVATTEAAAAPGDAGPSGQDSGSSGTSYDVAVPAGILLAIALIGGVLVVRHRGRHRTEPSAVSR
jgi:hypothetical protein